jgi:hypothetical protein
MRGCKRPEPAQFLVVGVLAVVVAAVAVARLIPHLPNFTPVGAVALFAGACLRPRWLAVMVPLLGLAVSDWFLAEVYHTAFIYDLPQQLSVYGMYAATAGLGMVIQRRSWLQVGGAALGSVLVFFVVTNFVVWSVTAFGVATYARDLSGLVMCYLAALPFLGSQLVAELSFTAILFGALAAGERWSAPAAAPSDVPLTVVQSA